MINKLYNWTSGTTISSAQVTAEFMQLINDSNQKAIDIANAQNFPKTYGIGSTAANITGTDLNDLDLTGFYRGSSLVNAPTGYTNGSIIHIKYDSTTAKQIFLHVNSDKMSQRVKFSGTWQPWTVVIGEVLYSGGSSMAGTVTITPSSSILNCPNGWVLRWNNNPSGDIFYQYIHKDCSKGSDIISIQPVGGGHTPTLAYKRVKISNTDITGHDFNIQGNNTGRILVEVRAW